MEQKQVLVNTPESGSTPVSATPIPNASMPAQSKSSGAKAWRVLDNTETVTGRPRHIVDAALIGTCIAFFIAFLGMQPKAIDASLHTAMIFFGWALPFLGWGFLNASVKEKSGSNLLLQSILIGNWVAEGFGQLMACIGIFFVIQHLDISASVAFLWASGIAVIGAPFLSFIGLLIYAGFASKAEEEAKKQLAASTVAPNRASNQGQEKTGP